MTWGGALLLALAVLSVMYLLTRLGEDPASVSSWQTWLLVPLGALLLAGFVRREARAPVPVLDVVLLRHRAFALVNALNLLYGAGVFGLLAFIPYYARLAYGMSNVASGGLLTARAVGMMVTATVTGMRLGRTGYRLPVAAGFLVLAASLVGLALIPPAAGAAGAMWAFWRLAGLIFVSGVGVGLASPSSNNAAIELMPEKMAAITGLRGMFRQTSCGSAPGAVGSPGGCATR